MEPCKPSLSKHFYELELLSILSFEPDVIAITETWLNDNRAGRIALPGYNLLLQ